MKHYEAIPKVQRSGAFTLKGIKPDLWREVKGAAALEGMTVGAWVLRAIERQVKVDLAELLKRKGGGR